MSTPTSSLFPVPKKLAQEAAEKARRFARATRKSYQAEKIAEAMKPRRHWLFWTKTWTEAEARAWCARVDCFGFPEDPRFGSGPNSWAEQWADDLLSAIRVAEGEVLYLAKLDAVRVHNFVNSDEQNT